MYLFNSIQTVNETHSL